MKISIICQYYPPEQAPIGVMVRELGEDLAARGHQVTIITGFPNHPSGVTFKGYRKKLFSLEKHGSLTVVRCYLYTSPRKSYVRRLLNYVTFAATSLAAVLKSGGYDVVYIPSPPLTNGIIALALKKMTGRPYLYNIQDIFPDAAITAGVLKHPRLIALARKLELAIYREAAGISVISEGFRDNLTAKGVRDSKISVIYNWLDTGEIVPLPRDNEFSRRQGLDGKFVVLYSGTIGLISGAEILLECARRLAVHPDLVLLLVGEGVAKEAIMKEARAGQIGNMVFLPFQDREHLSEVQSTADVSVVTLKPGMGMTSVPSKVLGYMAAARPVIASVDRDCDTSRFIQRARCGLVVPAGDAGELAAAISGLYQHRDRAREMGRNGRAFIEQHCARGPSTARYERALAGCLDHAGPPSQGGPQAKAGPSR